MNINKKLDRVKQWAGEKMGAESKTNVSADFKALEIEMALRHEGMEKLHKSMTSYVKSLSKRNEVEDREKILPIEYLGQVMATHGEDFESNSTFGNCLISMGRSNEKISRIQERYVASATTGWLESLERSLAMMKEYQTARKKLENRRLAYDASLSKMQKIKKEDFRVEEELRSQKAKYEESSEDVFRRMQDIKEAEAETVADLEAFMDAELDYYDRCRDELIRLRNNWPAGHRVLSQNENRHPSTRSRSNTAHTYSERYGACDASQVLESEAVRQSIRPQSRVVSSSSRTASSSQLNVRANTYDDHCDNDSPPRPKMGRSATYQGPTDTYRDSPPVSGSHKGLSHNDSDISQRQLRPSNKINARAPDVFGDPSDDSTVNSVSTDHSYRSVSPATSHGSIGNRPYSNVPNPNSVKKGPPPPPPSRAKKPPPPPPMRRV